MKDNNGFTLIEGLVVVVILATLAAVTLFLVHPDGDRYDRRRVAGVECLYDNVNQKIVSCDWGPS